MKSSQDSIVKDLVLIGGGHSHVAVLKKFGMKPIPGVRLTLIARDVETPYSGMLPGYVAGHYSFDEAHIDLRPLCQFASARLYHDTAIRVDTVNKKVICEGRPPVSYDLLSINIGSRPEINTVPGAAEFTTPVKPINRFVDKWHQLRDRVLQQSGPHRIAVVGSGAAGVEILLAVQFRLQALLVQNQRQNEQLEFHLISKSAQIMPAFPVGVARRMERILEQRGVHVHRDAEAIKVFDLGLELVDGDKLELDEILWVTGASAPAWLRESGLAVDAEGFIQASDCLQSTSHRDIFAAGDIVNVIDHPRPKAGVFAVRQGQPLAQNLRRALLNRPLKPFKPQKTLLALISSGDQYAIATKANWHFEAALLWKWKDWIDRRWMQQYTELPSMSDEMASSLDRRLADQDTLKEISAIAMRCGGCGAKVGANVLSRAIADLKPAARDDILIGLHEPDDAAVVEVPPGKVMVHTVDYFRSFIDDPFIFGQIAANHALSDVFAMGAEAQSALAIATVPFAIESKVEDTLRELMAGAMVVLNDANAALVGGHTSEGAELALGFAVNGVANREQILRKGGMREGDLLVLTKPLGTGTLFAADMQHKARGRWIEDAVKSMIQSNRQAAEALYAHGATACTDVTGFGLLGHLVEMIKPSAVDVEIDLAALPLIDGALETVAMGILSSLQPANLRLRRAIANREEAITSPLYPLVFDPQTSGGLLASLPANNTDACLHELIKRGYGQAAIVGRVKAQGANLEPVRLIR
ncbi:MAG: selenide, water dikinase SelD [Gammaproteobacteria bacterium]|jgi:selenide,water dikinase|nr:selenide, water dikinase SelD [Gammaproteobacteria bacterium]